MNETTPLINTMSSLSTSDRLQLLRVIQALEARIAALEAAAE
jgi:hypothetical protein